MTQNTKRKTIFHHIFLLPFAIAMFIALLFFHLILAIFHRIAFAILGLERVKRAPHFKVDYQKFAFLSRGGRIYGMLVHYPIGLFSYAKKIAQTLEAYFCVPVKIKGARFQMDKNQKRMNALRQKAEYKQAFKRKKKKKKA